MGTGSYAGHVAQKMFSTVAALVGEITTQYIIRYRPTATDDPRVFRRLRVEVALPNVKVRYREGYYPYAP